jgi:pimeloyl-ACP methyl ester carboxylesterase
LLQLLLLHACTTAAPPAGKDTGTNEPVEETGDDTDTAGETGDDTDTGGDTDTDTDTGEDTGTVDVVYAEGNGPWQVKEEEGKVGGQEVTWFIPKGGVDLPVVLWSHGFLRNRSFHAASARHAASWGLLVVTVDLPSATGGHEENGAYLADELLPAALARSEAGGTHAFVGHSAGGLASLLAAAEVGADAVVGLDPVDASGLGEAAAPHVTAPTLRLLGEPSTCNSSGNAREWEYGGTEWTVEVPDASHCDFEDPTEPGCTAFCGADDADRHATVHEYAVAWLVHTLLGGADEWIKGTEAEADRRAGSIDY